MSNSSFLLDGTLLAILAFRPAVEPVATFITLVTPTCDRQAFMVLELGRLSS